MQVPYTVPAVFLALAIPVSLNCGFPEASANHTTSTGEVAQEPAAAPAKAKPFELPEKSYQIPTDPSPILEQVTANEFAWQSFIAVNWPAATGEGTERGKPDTQRPFGAPGPVVWETYKNVMDVFLEDGAKPLPWNADGVPHAKDAAARVMPRVSKSKPDAHKIGHLLDLVQSQRQTQPGVSEFKSGISEAQPSVASWLVAQNQTLTRFEVFINKTVFDYVYENGFYDAKNQVNAVQPGGPGVASPIGAMEFKAAWIEITKGMDASRYHTTEATLDIDPNRENDKSRQATMGLVGLHIIHKTPNAPQYVWATFEHKDNCPDVGAGSKGDQWHYYSDTLNPKNFNMPPQQNPAQVVRMTPLPDEVKALNEKYQGAIRRDNQKHGIQSPWPNYQLVNTQWPSNSITVPPLTKAPLPGGNAIPRILANTTMETYVQDLSCLHCHINARISADGADEASAEFASDYSFVYGMAKSSK